MCVCDLDDDEALLHQIHLHLLVLYFITALQY